jgi:hypothetical protein
MRPIPQRPLPVLVCLRRRSPQPSPPTKLQPQGHLCYRRRLVGRMSPRAHVSRRAVKCVAVNTSMKALTRCYFVTTKAIIATALVEMDLCC